MAEAQAAVFAQPARNAGLQPKPQRGGTAALAVSPWGGYGGAKPFHARGYRGSPPRLKSERLGAAVDLCAAAGIKGRDRGAWQRLVRGEQPAKGFFVAEPAVE